MLVFSRGYSYSQVILICEVFSTLSMRRNFNVILVQAYNRVVFPGSETIDIKTSI